VWAGRSRVFFSALGGLAGKFAACLMCFITNSSSLNSHTRDSRFRRAIAGRKRADSCGLPTTPEPAPGARVTIPRVDATLRPSSYPAFGKNNYHNEMTGAICGCAPSCNYAWIGLPSSAPVSSCRAASFCYPRLPVLERSEKVTVDCIGREGSRDAARFRKRQVADASNAPDPSTVSPMRILR